MFLVFLSHKVDTVLFVLMSLMGRGQLPSTHKIGSKYTAYVQISLFINGVTPNIVLLCEGNATDTRR